MRQLFNESKVTGQDAATESFLEVMDRTRQNAVVYAEQLLPLSEEVVRSIGYCADYFKDLEFDDWVECLDDIIADVGKAEGFCNLLKHMHKTMIVDLKKNEDKAIVGIEMLEQMKIQYDRESVDLKRKATEKKDSAASKQFWGQVFTLGIYQYGGNTDYIESNQATACATAKKENAKIAEQAVGLTSAYLIPAVKEFITGLEVCSMFLSSTKERLSKLKNHASKGAKKPYYIMMKKQSTELNENCMKFLSFTDMLRTDLEAIPHDISDKNYVDTWLEHQLEEFKKQHNDESFLETSKKWFKSIRLEFSKSDEEN